MVGYLFPLVYCVAVSARGGSHTSWKITATNHSQIKQKIRRLYLHELISALQSHANYCPYMLLGNQLLLTLLYM